MSLSIIETKPNDGQKDRKAGKPKLMDWEWILFSYFSIHNHSPDSEVEYTTNYDVVSGDWREWFFPKFSYHEWAVVCDLQRTWGNEDPHVSRYG